MLILYILLKLVPGGLCAAVDIGWFWHVTDMHYDFTYNGRQLSCEVKISYPGMYGDFECDSPWTLVRSSISAMANIKQDVDFLLWTGDTVLHAPDDELSNEIINNIIENVTHALKSAFPDKPVYATFGNHDYHPSDQFPPHNNQLYNVTLLNWLSWISDAAQEESFLKGGYYSVKTQHGVRLVALNTNLYYIYNRQVAGETDPAYQFYWLNKTLAKARKTQEKVIITAHVPLGIQNPDGKLSMHDRFHSRLIQIFENYADTIVGMHFGHDHSDSFKVLSNTNLRSAVPVFIAPSVTPGLDRSGHNPAIRLVKYDRGTGRHLDIEQYFLDLRKANREKTARWELEYRASEAYRLTDVSAESLLSVQHRMKNMPSQEFQNFYIYHFVSARKELGKTCNRECHDKFVCGITELDLNKFDNCVQTHTSSKCSVRIALGYLLLFLSVTNTFL